MQDLIEQKDVLKKLKNYLDEVHFNDTYLDSQYVQELTNSINIIIGRINCELTDCDKELDQLCIQDDIR